MSICKELNDTDFSYLICDIIQCKKKLLQKVFLSVPEIIEYSHIQDLDRSIQWLSVRFALKYIVEKNGEKYCGLYKDRKGKPWLMSSTGFISISHCKKYVVAAFSKKYDVGVDIQFFEKKIFLVKEKFLSEIELLYLDLSIEKLCVMWSAKEAVYKIFSDSFSFKKNILIKDFFLQSSGIIEILCMGLKVFVWYEIFNSHVFCYTRSTCEKILGN